MSIVVPSSPESESIALPAATSVAATSCRGKSEISRTAESGTIVPQGGGAWFAGIIAKLWPERQRAKMLRYLIDVPDRTSRAIASGQREPGASDLGRLLRSDEGGRVLDAIMRGARSPWWHDLVEDRIIASAYRRSRVQIEEQLKLAFD